MFLELLLSGGISSLGQTIVDNWIGPIFYVAVAGFSLYFIKDRKFRELFSFLAIAAIVGLAVFMGKELFGNNKGLTKAAKGIADKVNIAQVRTLE